MSRTRKLEEKVNDLMSMLESSTTLVRSGNVSIPDINTTPMAIPPLNPGSTSQDYTSPSIPTPPGSCYGVSTAASAWDPTPLEAEQFLNVFRSSRSPLFPFVHIPNEKTAAELRAESPFLWLCIMYISMSRYDQSIEASYKIRQLLCQTMIMYFDKKLDILQGLLVYIGWTNQNTKEKPTLAVLTQLAVSVVFDLGLNRHIPTEISAMHTCIKGGGIPISLVRTMEERRAVLGCYLLTSVISGYLQRTDALRWTDHMEQSLQMIEAKRECEADLILVQQVKLQHIVEKINQDHWYNPNPDKPGQRPVIPIYIKALESSHNEVKRQTPLEVAQNQTILLHSLHVEIKIHELALFKDNESDFRRMENLLICFRAVRSFLDIILSMTGQGFLYFPFTMFSQTGHCLIALFKLTMFDDPMWDREYVRNTIDALATLDRVIEMLRQTAALVGEYEDDNPETNFFSKACRLMMQMRAGWAIKLEATSTVLPNPLHAEETIPDLFADFTNDKWLTDMLATWNG
ncbi:MAG: hypothetical protein M1820_005921 [Bogoriella megaspora]|nr:MAG: hypothetical protein M1820_005921 [Bogoriella megaspora]